MTSPQKENGFTAIANELIEVISKTPFNGTQFRILLVTFRYTYGFNRKEHDLSETFISKATGIHKKQISRELSTLIELNVISVIKEATFTTSRILKFNKDYSSWEVAKKLPPIEKDGSTGSELATSTGSENVTQERNNKDNINKSSSSNPFTHYEQNIGPLVNTSREMIIAWLDDDKHPEELICKAIDIAVMNNKRHLSYIEGILRNWQSRNIKTVDALESDKKEWSTKAPPFKKVVNMDEWK